MKTRILLFALLLSALACQTKKHPFDNPLDPDGVNFQGWQSPKVAAPEKVTAGATYSVIWNDVGVSSYRIEESENPSFTNATSHTVSGLSDSFNHDEADKTYYYRVKTNTGSKDSNWSNVDSVTIQEFITFVSIPGGTFQMGSNDGESDEKSVHTVTLSAFEMSVYEITQGQYKAVIGSNPSYFTGDDNLPVEQVNWWDAIKFCNALSVKEGFERCYNESTGACDFTKNGYRLPTEAEWEYACRAGTTTAYYTGDSESDLARAGWYNGNSGGSTHPVGEKTPNAWGLYDMHGNVQEWCNDWYGSYSSGSVSNPVGPSSGSSRVNRGGSWNYFDWVCRSADRNWIYPSYTYFNLDFRVVRR